MSEALRPAEHESIHTFLNNLEILFFPLDSGLLVFIVTYDAFTDDILQRGGTQGQLARPAGSAPPPPSRAASRSRPSCTLSERVSVICSFSFRSLTDADRSSYLRQCHLVQKNQERQPLRALSIPFQNMLRRITNPTLELEEEEKI